MVSHEFRTSLTNHHSILSEGLLAEWTRPETMTSKRRSQPMQIMSPRTGWKV